MTWYDTYEEIKTKYPDTVFEEYWLTEDDVPTHLLLQFTSSHGGAYIGSPGNSLWIDNVKLVY